MPKIISAAGGSPVIVPDVPTPVPPDARASLFDGPGDTPGLLRDTDWASTQLGPVEQWSDTLVQVVGLIMPSRMPMMLWWGPEFVQIYNDAYARLAGNKHPGAIGQPASQCWAEVWDALAPGAHRAMVDGESAYLERQLLLIDRHGYLEETYWTSSYSPVRDPAGEIVGVLVTSADVTETVVGARRLETVRQLGTLSSSTTVGLEQTCKAAIRVLAANRQAVPFATMHVIEPGGKTARLLASYGVAQGSAFNPAEVFDVADAPDIANAVSTGTRLLVPGLRARYGKGAFDPGPLGDAAPDAAMLLPVNVTGVEAPVAVATLGVNPYRAVDDVYLAFFQLVARQLRVAVSDAVAYESELHRASVLAELDEDKTSFYQNVSHELRTPVALVLGPLRELLSDPSALAPERREVLLSAQRAALRLRKLVDNMFQFSRVQTDELRAQFEPTDLAAFTAELAAMFRSLAEQAGLEFVVDVEAVTERVDVDREMWSQIVLNLLSNAMKFTYAGRIEVRLRRTSDADVVLEVSDTGVGIPTALQDRIFDRFSQVPGQSGRSAEGAGIGLALVRGLAVAMGGSVAVSSAPNRGSTFRVTLPVRSSPEHGDWARTPDRLEKWSPQAYLTEVESWMNDDAAGVAQPRRRPQAQAGQASNGRVLLVEDNHDMRGYLTRLLTDDGWVVEAVGSVNAALSTDMTPDIVVSDVMLPGLSGLDLVRMIRADEQLRRTPVILLTARFGPDAAAEGLDAGADDYIVKPFDPTELLARIRVHYELSRLREFALAQAEDRATHAEGEAGNLRIALSSNRQIGVAMGVLMARESLTEAQAFDKLRTASQHRNMKLRDIADEVVLTGHLE